MCDTILNEVTSPQRREKCQPRLHHAKGESMSIDLSYIMQRRERGWNFNHTVASVACMCLHANNNYNLLGDICQISVAAERLYTCTMHAEQPSNQTTGVSPESERTSLAGLSCSELSRAGRWAQEHPVSTVPSPWGQRRLYAQSQRWKRRRRGGGGKKKRAKRRQWERGREEVTNKQGSSWIQADLAVHPLPSWESHSKHTMYTHTDTDTN